MITAIVQKPNTPATTSMIILVNGDKPEELGSIATRNEVIKFARAKGFPVSGLGNIPSPYPIDEDGECTEDVFLGRKPIKGWQAEYTANMGIR
jgi:hypothetical protein